MKQRLLITGGSGYIGAMLADQLSSREDVEAILIIDKEEETYLTKNTAHKEKISFINDNLGNDESESDWIKAVKDFAPTIVIHTAWQIRDIYGNLPLQRKWNIDGSDHVFELVFTIPSVRRLIYFSTVASYGAFPDNSIEHRYKESEPFRVTDYNYAEEKRMVEENLKNRHEKAKEDGWHGQVYILRPAAITGPRGRVDRIRFGLQSALSGTLKGKSIIYSIISALVSWVPVTPNWLRQYIHEDDVNDIVELLAFNHETRDLYQVFNICPPGDVVLGKDMARAVGKKTLPIYPWMARLAFWFFWHVTRGKIPTSRGSWKGYSYPIAVDGSKLTEEYGYHYKHPSKEAFVKREGRYAKDLIKP
jgi:nucleoside-diphosphate-sugar epimerase